MRQKTLNTEGPSSSTAQRGPAHEHRPSGSLHKNNKDAGQGRCETCNCMVPTGSWSQHAAGIRHRRNVLSMRMYGEPGHHVVSSFEDAAMPLAPVSANLVTRDPVVAAARLRERTDSHCGASTSTAAAPAASSDKGSTGALGGHMTLQRLQQLLLRELAGQAGVGQMYNRAAARFGEQQLASASQRVQREVEHQQEGQVAGQGNRRLIVGAESGWPAADIACLALHVGHEACSWTELSLTVPYHTFGPESAAVTTACSVLAASLANSGSLQRLRLRFARADFLRILEQGGGTGAFWSLTRLWGYVLGALRRALQANATILEVVLEAPPSTFAPEDVSALQSAMLQAPPRLRMSALLGAHQRVGQASPIRRLPHELLARIVALAVPTNKRALLLRLQEPLDLRGSSSDDSSEDSSDSDGSDTDSEDEETEEGSEASGPPSPHDHADLAVAAAAASGHFGAFSGMAMPSSS